MQRCYLCTIKAVGVMGDSRTYENICLLRAVTSETVYKQIILVFQKNFIDIISNK